MRSEFIEGDGGVQLHCVSQGRGRLVLCLHGFPEFWYEWRALLPALSADRLVVVPDQRGYNLSDKPAEVAAYRIRHLVGDVRRVAAAYTSEPFTLVAHDWGAAVAWAYAIAHPDTLDRLVVINGPHPVPFSRALATDPAQQQASEYITRLRAPGAERWLAADDFGWLTRETLDAWGADQPTREAYRAAWSQPGALAAMLAWYRASPLYPPAAGDAGAMKRTLDPQDFIVRVPTLVIWGERDRMLLPVNLDGLEQCVPELRVERIAQATHWVLHEQSARVIELIQGFLR